MIDLIKEFTEIREKLIALVGEFPKEKRNKILFGDWNLKDLLSHLVGWDVYFTNALKLLEKDKVIAYWDKINEHNKREVEKRKALSYDQVYKQFVKSGGEFIKSYQSLSPEMREKIIWLDKKYTPLKFLKINIHHYKHHFKKIETAVPS